MLLKVAPQRMADCAGSAVAERQFGPALTVVPTVSVLMITYNHERFIRQAIESVFMQHVEFPIELVIGEDCSTDATRSVIEHACALAPICVRLLTSKKNVGMHGNFRRVANCATGRFVAILEGDDYWTSPDKLAIQVSYLCDHAETVGIAHRAEVVFDENTPTEQRAQWPDRFIPVDPAAQLTVQKIIRFDIMVPTASLVMQRSIVEDLPPWLDTLPMIDWYLSLRCALKGPLIMLPGVMSVYRIVRNGAVGKGSYVIFKHGQNELLERLAATQAGEMKSLLSSESQSGRHALAYWHESNGDIESARHLLRTMLARDLQRGKIKVETLAWYVRLRWPRLYRALRSVDSIGTMFRGTSKH